MKTLLGVSAALLTAGLCWQAQAQQQTVPTPSSQQIISQVPAQLNPVPPYPVPAPAAPPIAYAAPPPPSYRLPDENAGYGASLPPAYPQPDQAAGYGSASPPAYPPPAQPQR